VPSGSRSVWVLAWVIRDGAQPSRNEGSYDSNHDIPIEDNESPARRIHIHKVLQMGKYNI